MVLRQLALPILLFVVFAYPRPCLARWAKPGEALATILWSENNWRIADDGTFHHTLEVITQVEKDEGRKQEGTTQWTFNEGQTRMSSFKGWTTNGDKEIAVDPDKIQQRATGGNEAGFDQGMQLIIAFPEVAVGSKLKSLGEFEHHTATVPGFFAHSFAFGAGTLEQKGKVRLVSALPLYYEVSGPQGYVEVTSGKEGADYVLEISLIKEAYFHTRNEEYPWFADPPYPRVRVASSRDWTLIQRTFADNFAKVIADPLPAFMQTKVDTLKSKTLPLSDKAGELMAFMADNLRSIAGWRTIKGGYVPRPFKEVAASMSADCKDNAALLTKALRAMGYTADVALLSRSETPPERISLPTADAFNHAIVRAEDLDHKVLWLDPSNFNSYARGIRPSIANRFTLVLQSDGKNGVQETPKIDPHDNAFTMLDTIEPINSSTISHNVQFAFKGISAINLAGQTINQTDKQFEEQWTNFVVGQTAVLAASYQKPDLKSRLVKDASVSAQITARWLPQMTSAGYEMPIRSFHQHLQTMDLGDRVSDYYLGEPLFVTETRRIKNTRFVGREIKDCTLASRWMNLRRATRQAGKDIEITATAEVMLPFITLAELRSPEGTALRKKLRDCFSDMSIVFNPAHPLPDVDPYDIAH